MRQMVISRLIVLRKKMGYSARELSAKINRAENYIARIESGNHFPPIEDIECILKTCNSSFEELFYEDFDSYSIDKEILKKLKDIKPEGKKALITLLVYMYQNEKGKIQAV